MLVGLLEEFLLRAAYGGGEEGGVVDGVVEGQRFAVLEAGGRGGGVFSVSSVMVESLFPLLPDAA